MKRNPLSRDDVVRILNMVYSVFLAILARFAIQQTGGDATDPLDVKLLISEKNIFPVLLLSTYFVLDWLTTNSTLPTKTEASSHILLPFMVLGIVGLGGLVAFAFAPSAWWMVLLGLYASIVPWYDLIANDDSIQDTLQCLVTYAIVLFRVIAGVFLFLITLIQFWTHPNHQIELSEDWVIGFLIIYVALKAVRYFSLPFLQKAKVA